MVLINSILAFTLLFAHGIHSYCVTNKFRDLSTFSFSKSDTREPEKQEFVVLNMQAGSTMCCPIEDSRCIPNKAGDSILKYNIGLHHDPVLKVARCTSGGELIIGGTKENTYSECIDIHGESQMNRLIAVVRHAPHMFQDNTTWSYVAPINS